VRRGHGDLHLGNIAMIEGKPVPFDAIEFDPLIAAGDVLYDLAFLLMDLVERGLGSAANVVLNRYLIETRRAEDIDALAALPLFLSLRAAIRAKVTAARREFAPAGERARIDAAARAYFRLALSSIEPPAPRLVAIGGLSGTGKSTVARRLAPHLPPAPGALVVRSDIERKTMLRAAETDRLPPQAYRAEVTAQVYDALTDKARRALAAGHSVIVDAVFARPGERARIAAAAQAAGADFRGLFLLADLPVRIERIAARLADASDADAAVARRQEAYDLGALDWTRVDAAGPLDDTMAAVMAAAVPGGASHAVRSAAQGKTTGCARDPSRA
jgi:predicted kinase